MNFKKIEREAQKFIINNGVPKSYFFNDYKIDNHYVEKLKKFLDDDIKNLTSKEKEVLFFIIQSMIDTKAKPLEHECRNLRIKMNAVLIVLGILVTLIGSVMVPLLLKVTSGG